MKPALLSLLALIAFAQETPWTPFNDPTNKRQLERASTMDVLHYRIEVKLDDQGTKIEGRTAIDLTLTQPASSVELDAVAMKIAGVQAADGKPMAFTQIGGKLAVDLGRKAAAGDKIHVAISYTAEPTAGLFFVRPDAARPSRGWQAWTQGETEYNRHWFPCYDFPNDRATSEVVITVREKYRTVSNGALVKTDVKDGWRTDHWRMDVPHVTYLTSIAAGEFDIVEEKGPAPLRYVVPKGWHTEEEIRHTFERTAAMMKFFGDATGVPYPYAKYDQVVVEDFTWGGMENITATTLHPGSVVPKRSWADRDSDGLIAHELAHQWFGDLVTCRTWAHAWLNEGFATYMETLWQEKQGGREALVGALEDGAGWYFKEASDRYTRPTVCEHYTSPDDVFDSHIYPRGAWILHMLHVKLGDAAWWKGVNAYLTKHRAGVVTTDDFRAAMEAASGQNLKAFFDQWTRKAGYPVLRAAASWDEEKKTLLLQVNQVQTTRALKWLDLETEVPFFDLLIDVEIETKAGRQTKTLGCKMGFVANIPLDSEPTIINIDRDGSILKVLEFARTPEQLAYQLRNDDQPWHRWWAAENLKGFHEGVAALREALEKDPSNRVRIAAAKALGATGTPEARAALLGVRQPDARVRRAVIESLASHAKDAGDELEAILKDDASPACRAAAAASLGKRGRLSKVFMSWESYLQDDVIMPGFLAGMAESGDPALVAACRKAIAPSVHPVVRLRATEALGDVIAKFDNKKSFHPGFGDFTALFGDSNFRVRRAALQKAGAMDEETAVILEKRLPLETEERLQKEIREAIRKIRTPKK